MSPFEPSGRIVSSRETNSLAGGEKRDIFRMKNRPNKAPEPTPVAVMPRATSRVTEMKPQNQKRREARVTPATVVAHL